jgi:hypothetical protein
MSQFEPFAIALRLSGVTLTQKELDQALLQLTSRYEPEDSDGSYYAQVDIPVRNAARSILDLADRSGPTLARLLEERKIGKAVLDLAFDYPAEGEAMSARIPAHVAGAIAGYGVDLEVSVYLTDVEEDEED